MFQSTLQQHVNVKKHSLPWLYLSNHTSKKWAALCLQTILLLLQNQQLR